MPRINLIPWREAERKRKRQEFGVGALGALVAAGAIAFLVNLQMGAAIDNQKERNQYLNDEIAKLDKQITEILALEQQKQRLRARIQVIEQLERSRPEIVHVFDQLVRTIPDGVNLVALKQTDRKLQLQGPGAVEHARRLLHAQPRRLRMAEGPLARHSRDQGRQ